MKLMKILLTLFVVIFVIGVSSSFVLAQMSSTNYRIDWDNVGFGGGEDSSSASYRLYDSVGGQSIGETSSASYTARSGYRQGSYDRVVNFEFFAQNNSSQVAATAFSSTTVSVTSSSGFAVDDMIAIVQDAGASQVVSIGKITSIAANDLVVDYLTGTTPVIDGTNDVVYLLDSTAISFGSLTSAAISTGILAWEALADVDDGYSVYIYESSELTNGAVNIADVADGTVSAGVSEYGARSSDTTLSSTFDTQDTAFTSTPQVVGSRFATSYASRDFLTLKAGVSVAQASGSYAQVLNLIYVGDY